MARKMMDDELARVAMFVEYVRRGKCNISQAAQSCGASYATMYRHCRRAGILSEGRKELSLSNAQQQRVRRLRAAGFSERYIAAKIGCGRTAVRNAIRNDSK